MSKQDFIDVEHNLKAFNASLAEYQRVSGKTTEEVLAKQGSKLAFSISDALKMRSPSKGSVTAQRLSVLRSKQEGIFIRPNIRLAVASKVGAAVPLANKAQYIRGQKRTDKKFGTLSGIRFGFTKSKKNGVASTREGLNLQALMVKRELAAREKGRGYLGFGSRIDVSKIADVKLVKLFGRYKQELSKAGLQASTSETAITFTFGGSTAPDGRMVDLGPAISKPKNLQAVARGIADVRKDMAPYIAKKHAQALQASVDKALRSGGVQ